MAALAAGTKAPAIALSAIDGGRFSLHEALKHGPVLVAFFKVSCPVCQYTFPFLDRIHKNYGAQKITIVGVSQNDRRDTAAFLKEYGITFPTLLDDPNGYAVSNAYGLATVPTMFLIGQDGRIEVSSVGWVRSEIEDINGRLAGSPQAAIPELFQPGEQVADFRAG
jgi:peroxiredoxin